MAPVWKIRAGLCWNVHSFALKRLAWLQILTLDQTGLSEHLKLSELSTNVNERDVWVKGVKVTAASVRDVRRVG